MDSDRWGGLILSLLILVSIVEIITMVFVNQDDNRRAYLERCSVSNIEETMKNWTAWHYEIVEECGDDKPK